MTASTSKPRTSAVSASREDIGGTAPISPGERVWLDTKLPKGKYLLLSFIPDPNGAAHLKLGMIHPLTV